MSKLDATNLTGTLANSALVMAVCQAVDRRAVLKVCSLLRFSDQRIAINPIVAIAGP